MDHTRLAVVAVASLAVAVAARAADDALKAGTFSDPEIVSALQAADQSQVDTAELAIEKAGRVDVKTFARRMKKEHASSREKLSSLAARQNIIAKESDYSASLRSRGETLATEMRPLAGGAFDRAYIDGMVAEHQALLDSIDQRMIPGAQDSVLQSQLRKTRSSVAEHLRDARRIQERIAGVRDDDKERAVGPQEGSYP